MEYSRNKQFISFTFCAVLSSVSESHTFPLCPAWDVEHLFVQRYLSYISYLPINHAVAIQVTMLKKIVYLRLASTGGLRMYPHG